MMSLKESLQSITHIPRLLLPLKCDSQSVQHVMKINKAVMSGEIEAIW